MDIFDALQLLCGLSLFLFGMNGMGGALKRCGGNRMKSILSSLTSNPFKGFLLGLGVTAIIQSSSATTVMVVGFVNSGLMTLAQTIGIIMGANVGTAVTSWLTGLSGIEGGESVTSVIAWLKPSAWMPVLAVIGICTTMLAKSDRKKDVGHVLLGFAVLMTGMDLMSESVAGLKGDPDFAGILTMFENPLLGILAGLVLTAIVQSSSASVGILQTLTTTGAITYGAAFPIVMGQNIGTCVTALLSSIGANKNARRAALIHLYFNIISVCVVYGGFFTLDLFLNFAFVDKTIDMWGVAAVHTIFKLIAVVVFAPFCKHLETLARLTIKDDPEETEKVNLLDDRLLATPSVAVEQAEKITARMAHLACTALENSLSLLDAYDEKIAAQIRADESEVDEYEDMLGGYLIKLSAHDLSESDSHSVTKLLHVIGDFERISDHAVNIVESAEELREKRIAFSERAQSELSVMRAAVSETVLMACDAYVKRDFEAAALVEPLEQVVDHLRDQIKMQHILRLQKSECTIEHGFVLSDILNNLERVADHCSNIAACMIELSKHDVLGMHRYTRDIRSGSEDFNQSYRAYLNKYSLPQH